MKIMLDFKVVSKDGLPKESGEYFVARELCDGTAQVFICEYSVRHKAFNAYDCLPSAEYAITDNVAYCKIPQKKFNNLIKTEVI